MIRRGRAERQRLRGDLAPRPPDRRPARRLVPLRRRGRAWSRSDQFDKAAADYQQAERLGRREEVLDFQTHCVVDCTKAERWAEALWYLDRLIAARPDDGTLHEDRAAVYGKLGREADRQAELARVFELGADEGLGHPPGRGARPRRPLGRGRGPAGALRPDRSAQPGAGPGLGHRLPEGGRPCRLPRGLRGVPGLPGAGPDGRLERNQRGVALRPGRPRAWTTTECRWDGSSTGCPPSPRRALCTVTCFSNALGGLLLRAGRIDEAIARVNEGIAAAKEVEIPTDWAYLALAHARKGSLAEARRWLERLRTSRPDSVVILLGSPGACPPPERGRVAALRRRVSR